MKIKAIVRYNYHEPGEIFNAPSADARAWIRKGFAKEVIERKADRKAKNIIGKKVEKKAPLAPPADKMVKSSTTK